MIRWWQKVRTSVKMLIFPLIALQFFRTLIYPNPFEVLVLFALFLLFIGLLSNQI